METERVKNKERIEIQEKMEDKDMTKIEHK